MLIKSEIPFEKFKSYRQTLPSGRVYVHLYRGKYKKRRIISYARYVWSVAHGKEPDKSFDVDHINGDPTDDRLDNLRLLSKQLNRGLKQRQKGKSFVRIKCPNCNNIFEKEVRQTFIARRGKYTCCSEYCSFSFLKHSGKMSSNELTQLGLASIIDRFKKYQETSV